MNSPQLTVIAGPNGSGKSTLIEFLMQSGIEFGNYINADDIAKTLETKGDVGSLEAQQIADKMREECLSDRQDFAFETVMSHPSKVEFMERSRSLGYCVTLYFVATDNPLLNVERVRARVKVGGHPVPEDRIISRYSRAVALLAPAIIAANKAVVFDNSASYANKGFEGLRPVLKTETIRSQENTIQIELFAPFLKWSTEALKFEALGYETSVISKVGNNAMVRLQLATASQIPTSFIEKFGRFVDELFLSN